MIAIDLIFVCGPKMSSFRVGIGIGLVSVWVDEIDLMSAWEIEIDMVSV